MKQTENVKKQTDFAVLYFSSAIGREEEWNRWSEVYKIEKGLQQEEYLQILENVKAEQVVLVDGDRISPEQAARLIRDKEPVFPRAEVGYLADPKDRPFLKIFEKGWGTLSRSVLTSPLLAGNKDIFLKAYAGSDLAENPLTSIGYSLQKIFVRFCAYGQWERQKGKESRVKMASRYYLRLPFFYFFSGRFFRELFQYQGKSRREMVYRMLMFFFAVFCYFYFPYISQDYGITGDEQIDEQQAANVLNYFSKGDKAALNQPRTLLHLYGSSVQVMMKAISEVCHMDNIYEFRHRCCSLIGAWGIWIVGLLGLRLGGGLCGLLSMVLMFLTPRYFGHSMNNLKDVPFAVGYVLSVYYFIRLFDRYPVFKLSSVIGGMTGIFLALGTRSGGLVLFPYLFMYGGLFYIGRVGVKEFWKFVRYKEDVLRIWFVMILVLAGGYVLSILLWPYALQKPLMNVVESMRQFVHVNTGIRTIFDGQQMMSNMLPSGYAPKYLAIGMPVVTVTGFLGYCMYLCFRRKEFSLVTYFILFAAVFPVFWVVYQKSNLYGGIRHLLFVMPCMVVGASGFWSGLMNTAGKYVRLSVVVVWLGLAVLPLGHMVKNHPNEYVYFNEFVGGLKGVYGDFELDYYFNSLKQSCDWFKKNVSLPQDRKTVIVTQFTPAVSYYFRKDTNIMVVYSRYYEKYSKDWDYAIFGNVYVHRYQLQHQLFPIEGTLYASSVDGLPLSIVAQRVTKEDLKGFEAERRQQVPEAIAAFEAYVAEHKQNEEVWSQLAKLYYLTRRWEKAEVCIGKALDLHPFLSQALYLSALVDMQQKEYNKALQSARKMLAENSSSPDAHYLEALTFFHMKKYQEAIKVLNRGLSFRANDERLWGLAGDIMRLNGNYRQAVEIYRQMLSYNRKITTMILLADSYCRLKEFKQCEEILSQVIKMQEGYYPVYRVMARMRYMQNRIPEMGQLLARLNEVGNDADLFVLRGYYFDAVGSKQEARQMFDYALQLEPENSEALKFRRQ